MLRRPKSDDEIAVLDRILMTSFSIAHSWSEWMDRLGRENLRVFEENGRIIGGVGFYRMAQWFGGASIPIGGLAGVAMALEERGHGRAAKMCGQLLLELAEEGVPIAGLYASTATLYRSIGFEQAGTKLTYRATTNMFGKGSHDLPCREIDPREWAILKPMYDARARSWTGHLDRTRGIWERIVTARAGMRMCAYTFGEPLEGYVIVQQTPLETRWFDIHLRDAVLATPAAAKRLVALFSDLRAMTRHVSWTGAAADPIVGLLPEQTQEVVGNERWMLRILDVARALELRGYPPISGEVHLRIRDALIPKNDRAFVLRLDRGTPRVEIGGRGDVALDIRALAAMYSGFAHPYAMHVAGLLEGDASLLASAFAGPEPWCCDHY